MATANTPCVCGERLTTFKYDGAMRTAPVYFICATHRNQPMALVNARRELRRRLERKALPAPEAKS